MSEEKPGRNNVIIGGSKVPNCNHCVLIGANLTPTEDYSIIVGSSKVNISRKMTNEEFETIVNTFEEIRDLQRKNWGSSEKREREKE